MNYFDSTFKAEMGKMAKRKMLDGGQIQAFSPFLEKGLNALLPGVGSVAAPLITGLVGNHIDQGNQLKSIVDSKNQLDAAINPYQMKKGGYLKDKNTYVTKDGKETRRGLWANVYLKKKRGKRDGGMIDNSMVDGGRMMNVSDDAQQVKANNPQETDSVETPQAFLDHNEMIVDMPNGGKFVFSDYLKEESTGESFAAIAKGLIEKRDSGELSDQEYNELITELSNDNEKAKNMNNKKKTMKKGGKMMYAEGGDMMGMGQDPMMEGEPMQQEGAEQMSPDVMPEMGVEGDMGMGNMTEEGFPVDMPDGQQYMFSPDLKEPTTGKSFASMAQELKMMMDQGQIQEQDYMTAIQNLAQQQEQMKSGMTEKQKAGMKCGGYMKKKRMMGGGYVSPDKFKMMYNGRSR